MDKEILNKLKTNLSKLEQKKEQKEQKEKEIMCKDTEKIYYEIWKQILKHMNRKEEFRVNFKFGVFIQIIEINDIPKKAIVCSNIDREKLYRTLLSDGLDCSYYGYPTKGLTMNIKLNELRNSICYITQENFLFSTTIKSLSTNFKLSTQNNCFIRFSRSF